MYIHMHMYAFFKLDPSTMDRIELAFRRFDLNNDGFLSQDEFRQVNMNNTW